MDKEEEKVTHILSSKMKVVASSKGEVYRLLKNKGQLYLLPKNIANSDFICDIMFGMKKVIKCNDLQMVSIPHGKELSIAKILEFARTKCSIDRYLPDLKKDTLPPREYVCNIIHILIPREFESWIEAKMNEREKAFIKKKELKMIVLSEFRQLFDTATTISKCNGKFHELIKGSKKRREDKLGKKSTEEMNKVLKEESEEKSKLIQRLQQQVDDFQNVYDKNQDHMDKLAHLYELGVIDENGNPILKDHEGKQEDDM